MLRIDVVTLFPEMIISASSFGVLGQALKNNLLELNALSPRQWASDKHKTVDDRPFGGGDGMIMLAETLDQAIRSVKHKNSKVIYLSPQGKTLSAGKARALAQAEHLVLVCGRYGGIDQRIINQHIDEEISIGDYVLSGGELGALVVIDALSRFIPGVLGHESSAELDSFSEGLLEQPHFTRPRSFAQQEVPEVLLSGNHRLISEWSSQVAALVTLKKRPDLFKIYIEKKEQQYSLDKKKKGLSAKEDLRKFWQSLAEQDLLALGLEELQEDDWNV